MSFVDVLPVEPVMPTNGRARRRGRVRAIAASAANSSSGTSVRGAAVARVADEVAPPRRRRRGRPAGRARVDLEPVIVADPLERRRARAPAILDAIGITRAAPRGRRRGRRTAASRRRLLALLVALAGDHDDVARLGERDRARDRRAAVGVDLDARAGALEDVLDDRQRLLAARVVGRDDDDVGEAAATLPISGRLPRSRSPPAPKTTMHAGRRQLARRRAGRCRASRACARSRRARETAALVDGLEPPGHAVERRDPGGDLVVVDVEQDRRGDRRRGRSRR
jgi:hypothetical protein